MNLMESAKEMFNFNSDIFKKYFKNTSWLMFERLVNVVLGFIVGVYVARYLGPTQYGLLSYVNSFVGLFMAMATLGLESIVVRELVKTPHKKNELLGTAFYLKVMGTMFMWIVITIAVVLMKSDFQSSCLVAIIACSIVFQAFNVISFYFQADVKLKYAVHAQLVQLIVSATLKLIFIMLKLPLIWFAFIFLVDAIILAIGLTVMYWRKSGEIGCWRWSTETAKELLRDSWPLMFAYMSYLVYTRIDQVMIKNMLDDHSVGIYAAAYRLYEAPLFIALLTAKSICPLIVEYFQNNKEKLFSFYLQASSYMTLLAYIFIIIFFLFSKKLVLLLYGEKFMESSKVLMVLSLGLIPMFNAFLRSTYITVSNNQKIILYTTVFSAGLNVILNVYFIRLFDILGAVYATVITQIFSLFLLNIIFSPTRKIFFIQSKALLLMGIRR